jgi:hypothetical protein
MSARVVVSLLVALSGAACPRPLASTAGSRGATIHLFLGAEHVATISETRDGDIVRRRSALVGSPSDVSTLEVELDDSGLVRRARYERHGPRGARLVEVGRDDRGVLALKTPAGSWALPADLVLLETLHHLAPAPRSVSLLDLASLETEHANIEVLGGEIVALDRQGVEIARVSAGRPDRQGPGAFVERAPSQRGGAPVQVRPATARPPSRPYRLHLDGLGRLGAGLAAPGQRRVSPGVIEIDRRHLSREPTPHPTHERAAPFLEADDPRVAAFVSASVPDSASTPTVVALALAEAIQDRLDTSRGGGPPSALGTLERWAGDCDDATALLVAGLRTRGIAARPVVGYRWVGGRWGPHSWALFFDEAAGHWVPVDALVPGVGPFETHVALFEGLGSPLTIGRVLGLVEPRIEELSRAGGEASAADAGPGPAVR